MDFQCIWGSFQGGTHHHLQFTPSNTWRHRSKTTPNWGSRGSPPPHSWWCHCSLRVDGPHCQWACVDVAHKLPGDILAVAKHGRTALHWRSGTASEVKVYWTASDDVDCRAYHKCLSNMSTILVCLVKPMILSQGTQQHQNVAKHRVKHRPSTLSRTRKKTKSSSARPQVTSVTSVTSPKAGRPDQSEGEPGMAGRNRSKNDVPHLQMWFRNHGVYPNHKSHPIFHMFSLW